MHIRCKCHPEGNTPSSTMPLKRFHGGAGGNFEAARQVAFETFPAGERLESHALTSAATGGCSLGLSVICFWLLGRRDASSSTIHNLRSSSRTWRLGGEIFRGAHAPPRVVSGALDGNRVTMAGRASLAERIGPGLRSDRTASARSGPRGGACAPRRFALLHLRSTILHPPSRSLRLRGEYFQLG